MNTRDLHRAVARATGESVATIAKIGFQALRKSALEQDPEEYIIDWDELEQSERFTLFQQV